MATSDTDALSAIRLTRVIEEHDFKKTCVNYESGNRNVKKVVNLWNSFEDCDVGIHAYGIMISYFAKLKKKRAAFKLISEMKTRNLSSSVSVFNSTIDMLKRNRQQADWKALSAIFREMASVGMTPNNASYTKTVQCCVFWKHEAATVRVLNLMTESELPVNSLLLATAVSCFTNIRRGLVFVSSYPTDVCYHPIVFNSLMNISARDGDITSCWKTYRTMIHHKQKPTLNSYTILLNAHKEALDLFGCIEVLELMKRNHFNADEVSYTTILRLCNKLLECDDVEKQSILKIALEIFYEAKQNKKISSLRLLREIREIFKGDDQMLSNIKQSASEQGVHY